MADARQMPLLSARAIAEEHAAADKIFVKDFVVDLNIGVYAEEKGVTQKVRISVEAGFAADVRAVSDDIAHVPSYADIIDAIHAIAASGHIELVETFAERIAEYGFRDIRIVTMRIRLEKLERGPLRGVEILRHRDDAAGRA